MESPVTAPIRFRCFPFISSRKVNHGFLTLSGTTSLGHRTGHIRNSNKQNRFLVSAKCANECGRGPLNLENRKGWIHFVGVGGCGMSALAMLVLNQLVGCSGYEVSGSDIAWSSFMDRLQKAGATLHVGHSVLNTQKHDGLSLPDGIVISSAVPHDNVEVLFANSVGVPVYKRGSWLGKITKGYNLIAVTGSHGKTTTASMLAYVLKAVGDDLTALVGGFVPQFPDGNIISGSSQNFVLEADEYDNCFLELSPFIAVVTNLDWEHVDIFETKEAVITAFRKFLNKIKSGGHLLICGDCPGARSLIDHMTTETISEYSSGEMLILSPELCVGGYRTTTYGISGNNEWSASSIHPNLLGGSDYTLCHKGNPVADISLQIPGVHNILNSLAVIVTMMILSSDRMPSYDVIYEVKSPLINFSGVSRRFEMVGSICGCSVYDDYAHHPTEICSVLEAARQRFPHKAIIVVFQPHTYSRLAALKADFASALSKADQVLITAVQVYAAREADAYNVSGRDLAKSILGPPSEHVPELDDVVNKLASQITCDPDREIVVLTLGAGDVTTVGSSLLQKLQQLNVDH